MKINFYISLLCGILVFASCNRECDDIKGGDPQELITTVTYTLTSLDSSGIAFLSFMDLDGDGGNAPVIITSNLAANTTYNGTITLLNEAESPAENITEEVALEDAEHQIFFQVADADLTVEYADTDDNGNPLGLSTTLTTGDAGMGTLTIILRHEPEKNAEGVSDGDISNAGGETDIEVTFSIFIQKII